MICSIRNPRAGFGTSGQTLARCGQIWPKPQSGAKGLGSIRRRTLISVSRISHLRFSSSNFGLDAGKATSCWADSSHRSPGWPYMVPRAGPFPRALGHQPADLGQHVSITAAKALQYQSGFSSFRPDLALPHQIRLHRALLPALRGAILRRRHHLSVHREPTPPTQPHNRPKPDLTHCAGSS